MQYSIESKSQLAKLLASENLTVEHKKMKTAMFDLKNRVLYCPIWQKMSGEMYDLLLGHEVGHALETPPQGWHDAVTTGASGKYSKNFKHFLNVVEDARIEKKIKRKFPGLRQSFVKAYGELLEQNFFGIKGRDLNELPFIDRLNLFTKGGYSLDIKFKPEEQSLLLDIEKCETWEDVVRVTGLVYDYSKNEQQEMQIKQHSFYEFDDFNSDDYEESEYEEDFDDETTENDGVGSEKQSDKDGEETDETEGDAKSGTDSKSDENESGDENGGKEIIREKESVNSSLSDAEAFDSDFEPTCQTDENFRENEARLLDDKCKDYVYVTIPKFIPENSITGYKRVHQLMEQAWTDSYGSVSLLQKQNEALSEFKRKNERYVGLLAKEFEMRKAAAKFAKAKISETGDIDINRIYKYQIDDNIFRKMMRIPKGKSHGLILLLDRSGSMDGNMENSIEQILILAMFCRKVNIPFVVYGFGNCETGRRYDTGDSSYQIKPTFSRQPNELGFSDVFLREYMNSNMGNAEYTRCLRNMVALMHSYEPRYSRKFVRPYTETLSNTPMVEAMVAMRTITDEFRKVNNLDIVNLALVHDGDADTISYAHGDVNVNYIDCERQNVVLRDKQSKFEYLMKRMPTDVDSSPLRAATFDWYRKVTGAKIVGFFIVGSGNSARNAIARRYVRPDSTTLISEDRHSHNEWLRKQEEAKNMHRLLKEKKFLESYNKGYNKLFLIPGGSELDVDSDELTVEGTVTAIKLRNAFIKMNKKKQVNRVLVNRFIGEIAV